MMLLEFFCLGNADEETAKNRPASFSAVSLCKLNVSLKLFFNSNSVHSDSFVLDFG